MMVNCPKCGFSQPEDQYCAQCGVDMLAFRPTQKPLLSRFFGQTSVQILLLVMVTISVFWVARQQRHRELAERIAEIENASNTQIVNRRLNPDAQAKTELASSSPSASQSGSSSDTPSGASESSTAQVAAADSAPSAAGAQPSGSPSPDDAAKQGAAKAATSGSTAPAAPATPGAVPRMVQVSFMSASKQAINEMMALADPRSTATYGPVSTAVIPQIANRLRALQSTEYFEMLDAGSRNIKGTQGLEFYGGQRDEASGQYLGFVIDVVPGQLDEAIEPVFHTRAWHYLREGAGTQEFAVPLPESFTIPKGGGAVIVGALGIKRNSESDRRLYDPIKVLHILSTDAYRNGLSDLVIVIEPK